MHVFLSRLKYVLEGHSQVSMELIFIYESKHVAHF